jgi:hypothetical protein
VRVRVSIDVPAALLQEIAPARGGLPASPLRAGGDSEALPSLGTDRVERSSGAVADALQSFARTRAHASPIAHARYVHHGALRVPVHAEAQFAQAVRYLARDTVMQRIIARVERAHAQYTLRIVHDDADGYDPRSRTISWDPHSALRTTRGGRQSPALGLGHELDHAAEPWRLRDAGEVRRLPGFDNAEERRVIRGSERHAAHTLGEGVRTNHRGSCYRVDSPTAR